ncbi:zinc finger protein 469 [Cynocephalus volans]|uniref:zinc finger protein 469 n=1 Tax=Cynocephalus volans TaxID=110931 RepID=UPI002FC63CD2
MPGEQPRGAPPPTMTGDLQPCQVARGLGRPSQPPHEDHAPANRATKGTREAGSGAQAVESPEAQPRQTREGKPTASLLRTQALISPPGKEGSPRAPPGRSQAQGHTRLAGRADSSAQQLYGLSIASSRAKPTPDETPESPQLKAPEAPEAEAPQGHGTGAHLRPSLPQVGAPPTPEELSFQRCFQETPSSFTSTNYTSPNATPGPPPLRAPQSSGASPCRPASYPEFQADRTNSWPPATENSFPGANFGVPPTKPEPFPEGSRPSSPGVVSFQYPFPALPRAGPKSFPADTAGQEYGNGALAFAFHRPPGAWPEGTVGASPAYSLPTRPTHCYPGQPGSLNSPSDLTSALSPPGAAHPAPSPFPDGLHKSLTNTLPERPPSAPDRLGSPNSLPQRHFAGQVYRTSGVGTSPGPLDTELAPPGPPPTRLPLLWDPTAAPYPIPPLGPPAAAARATFFGDQTSPSQRLCLPPSPPLPWPHVIPPTTPSPHQVEMLSRLPFPVGVPEWPGGSQGAPSAAAGKTLAPGEKLAVMRSSPSQPGSSPGLFSYNGLKDPGTQPLFFGVAQPQVSPRGTPSLPPPRAMGASPSESPLPSPATNTAGSSTCSSLSPLSSSPANPSSEESQLPGPLGPSAFFHPPTHPQETGSPFPSPEPPHALPTHYQPEPAKAFPFPADRLAAEGAFKCLEEAPFPGEGPEAGRGRLSGFPQEPPPYSDQHFSLSSASLDQLDVLLTCKQCDRTYSSLAAFLAHRQFCSLLLARAKDGPPQPPNPPGLPAPTTTPMAPTNVHPGMLNHTKPVPFLLAGDVQAEGKDDPLRTSFLPGLAATPFPLPASDLDMEDDAKLDSLITEALNGMEYQSDNPEIDSSFIDVFADEEPSGPRGPSAGQPLKTRVGVTPEDKAQLPPPAVAATPEPQAPCPGDRGYPAQSRPKTRSLGLAPAEADPTSLVRRQRRGKQFKLFRKELDTASPAKGPSRGTRAACLRPRRKGTRAQRPPPRPRDLRAQAPKSQADPENRALRATPLAKETKSSRRPRLPPRKDGRKRRAQGGTWSKELIHKIVQQKNQLYKRQVQPGLGPHGSLAAERPLPSAKDTRFQEYDYASESEEDERPRQRGPGFRGRPRHGCRRWCRSEKRKEADLTRGPRVDEGQQKPRTVVRQQTREPHRPGPDPSKSPEAHSPSRRPEARVTPTERVPTPANHPTEASQHPPEAPTNTKTPEENHPLLDIPQETKKPEIAEESPPNTTKLRQGLSLSPALSVTESPRFPTSEQPRPGTEDSGRPTVLPVSCDREDLPASQPGELLAPAAHSTDAAYPEPSLLFLKNSDLSCDPACFSGDSVQVPLDEKGSQSYSSSPSELFLGPKVLAGCFPEDLHSKSSAVDTLPASSSYVCQDGVDASALEPKPPKNPPYPAEADPGKAESPLTLESTSLFSGLPADGFDPPLYDSLSANRDTHVPLACANLPPKKPPSEPPYPSFLLLEEASSMLPSHFPDLAGGKAFREKGPREGTAVPSPPPGPGKGSECNVPFVSNLSEDELEIKRLVTELESQLQSSHSSHGAPREPGGTESVGRVHMGTEPSSPLPAPRATPPHEHAFSAVNLTGLGESSPHQEGAGAAMATTEGTLGSPPGEWPCPASLHPGEAALPPSTHEDLASGAPFSHLGTSLRVSKAGRDSRVPLGVCFPDPGKPPEPLRDAGSSAKCSPNCELLLPRSKETAGAQGSQDSPLWPPPYEQRGGLSPEPRKADGPCQDSPALEAFGNPVGPLAPGLVLQGDVPLPPAATPPPGFSNSGAAQGCSVGRAGGPRGARLPHHMVEGPGFECKGFSPGGASPLTALQGGEARFVPMLSPACVPDAGPGRRLQDPASSPLDQPQLLGARATESKEDTQDLQGPPPANTQGLQQGDLSDPEKESVDGGKVAGSPGRGSQGSTQVTAVPAVAGRQLGPETDGHMGSPGQTEKPKDYSKASGLRPDTWGSPGGQDNFTSVSADPETAGARPAEGEHELGEGREARGLQNEARPTPNPTSPDGESSEPALTAASSQNGPKDQSPQKASSTGHNMQLLLAGDLAACAPLPSSSATPIFCSLEHLPQEDPPIPPSGARDAKGERRGQLPASPSCNDASSPQHLPVCSPAWEPLEEANCVQAPPDAVVWGPSVAVLACHPLLGDSSLLGDPPACQPRFVNVLTSICWGDGPKESTLRTTEDSRKERPRGSPACAAPPPSVRAVSPQVAVKTAGPSSIPAKDETEAVRGSRVPDTPCRGAPPHSSPGRMPKGPSSDPPSKTANLDHREGQKVTTVPTDPTTLGTAGPESHACLESEAEAGCKGLEDPGTPEAGHSGITKVTRGGSTGSIVPCPSAELHLSRATSPSSTARDFRCNSPQSHKNVPQQTPKGDPISPQDLKQRPCGFKKKPVSMENGHWKGRAPGGPPVTCEVCAASFRSGPGLSRHKARKHQPHRRATSKPSPPVQPPEPTVQTCQPPGKKSHKGPGKERPRLAGPSRATGPPPIQGSAAPGDTLGPEPSKEGQQALGILGTPDSPPNQQLHPPGLMQQGVCVKPTGLEPRRPDQAEEDTLHPKQAENREGQRQSRVPTTSPSNRKSNKKVAKLGVRRFREQSTPQASPDVISDRRCSNPSTAIANYTAPPSCCLPAAGEREANVGQPPGSAMPGPRVVEDAMEMSPRGWMIRPGRMEGASPGDRASGICKEPSQAAGSKPTEDSRGAESGSGEGIWEGHEPRSGPPDPPETPSSEAGSCLQGPEGTAPESPSPGSRDPLGLFDDETSFSQLFPLSGRLTQKKNLRVYGKRCQEPKRPPPQPSRGVGGGPPLCPTRLPTDLSDSGSLCLSHEDLWDDEATGLPESFLLDGFLNSKVPGIDPWAPSLCLWTLEPNREADGTEEAVSCCSEDDRSETIPELHMVPAAWRGLELRAPADETSSSLGDMSPEPPNLERERYDGGLSGNAGLLPLHAVDFELLSTKFEVQDLCFLGRCDDLVDLSSKSFSDFKATMNAQEPQNKRTEEAAKARRAQGRDRPAKGRQAPYKCKVCFQRFHGLGELDLHKLAHSASPPPTCHLCVERRFGSRELLREHLQEKHLPGKAGPWACGMCLKEVADIWMYNEHLREHAVQFARKGQARRSLGDLPGGLEGDSSVTHFLNSIVEQASKPHRAKHSRGRAGGSPEETRKQDRGSGRETARERAKPRAWAESSNQDGSWTPDSILADCSSLSPCENPTPTSGSATLPGSTKTSPSLSPDRWCSSEPVLQAIPVHEDCKDPSRDCHHCGKQFPKPFKLQRHLSVHSPQRVYLCPHCPGVYPEPHELRAHLSRVHRVQEERELPHTPLYTCELCANVMRVIRRSFICSTCNYTFAKKEQFDRHMDKHLRRGQQPFPFRGVRRPGAPRQKAPALEGVLPRKRRRVAMPSSPALGQGSLPALLQLCLEVAPSTSQGWPETQEKPVEPVDHPAREANPPADHQELPPLSLSSFPAALADGEGGHQPDGALERPEVTASPGSPEPLLQQALPSRASLAQSGTRGQDAEGKRAPHLFSGKHRTPSAHGKCAPDHSPEGSSLLVSTCHVLSEGGTRGPSHKGHATKPGGCRSSWKDRSAESTPNKVPKFPVHPRKSVGSPAPRKPPHGTEDRMKPTTPKATPGPSSQGSGGSRTSVKMGGGSQPQPASGQLQSEMATTLAKPSCPRRSPAADKPPPQAQARVCTKEFQGSPGPREKGQTSEKRRRGQALGPARSEVVGSLGNAPLAPEKPPRTPRKQATPSRLLPAKPRPSSYSSKTRLQPSEQRKGETNHTHRKEGLGKAFPLARPLLRPPKRGSAVRGAEPADPRDYRTAESQSDVLSQLFGQRLTSFKIPLKKDAAE